MTNAQSILLDSIISETKELALWHGKDGVTRLDVKNQYFRIGGMIHALRIIGGNCDVLGLVVPLAKAKEAALPNCMDIDHLRTI